MSVAGGVSLGSVGAVVGVSVGVSVGGSVVGGGVVVGGSVVGVSAPWLVGELSGGGMTVALMTGLRLPLALMATESAVMSIRT